MRVSMNELIKVLVIICLVAHLAVLARTTMKMVETAPSRGNYDAQDRPPLEAPRTIGPLSTFNISDHMSMKEKSHGLPINALDLMTHYPQIPLDDLINTDPNPKCRRQKVGKTLIQSSIDLPESVTHPPGRKIPKIVHITTKTRCMPPMLQENLERWRFPKHNFYVHDDAAVQRLLYETYWPEFPHLNLLRPCMISGAAMADLWRYLVLYQYGGIYTDMDAAPGPKFENATIIKDDDDAWFVVERIGIPSQYFMAASPRHPLMYLLVTVTLRRLLEVQDVGTQYVPYVTGPGALKEAWMLFTNSFSTDSGENDKERAAEEEAQEGDTSRSDRDPAASEHESEASQGQRRRLLETINANSQRSITTTLKTSKEKASELRKAEEEAKNERKRQSQPRMEGGVYVGMLNRTVTIAGNRGNTREIVIREALKKKKNQWKAMGMRHFQHSKDISLNMTCYERIYSLFLPPKNA